MDKIIVAITAVLMLIWTIVVIIVVSPMWTFCLLCNKIRDRIRLAWDREEFKSLHGEIDVGLGQLERCEMDECDDLASDIKAKGRKRLRKRLNTNEIL